MARTYGLWYVKDFNDDFNFPCRLVIHNNKSAWEWVTIHFLLFIITRNVYKVKTQKGNPVPAAEYQHFQCETPVCLAPLCRDEMEFQSCPAASTPALKWWN